MRSIFLLMAFLFPLLPNLASAERTQITFDMSGANWDGDGATAGGLDAGMPGDKAALVASAKQSDGFPQRAELKVTLSNDLTTDGDVTFEIGIRSNAMQTNRGKIFWNDVLVGEMDAYDGHEVSRTAVFIVPAEKLKLTAGEHTIAIEAGLSENQWDFFQLDALKLTAGSETNLQGGHLIPYEILTFQDGNWAGDGNTWGGVDSFADPNGDMGAIRVAATVSTPTASHTHAFRLKQDFSAADVRATVTFRRNENMARQGRLILNGAPIISVEPFLSRELLEKRDSVLETTSVLLQQSSHGLSPGRHELTIEASNPGERQSADFQVDSLMFEVVTQFDKPRIPFHSIAVSHRERLTGPAAIAMAKLEKAIAELGGTFTNDGTSGAVLILQDQNLVTALQRRLRRATPWERRDSYIIKTEFTHGRPTISLAALDPLGLTFALSDLQVRLRKDEKGQTALHLPESGEIIETPDNDTRGEYVNIGYNIPGITPHNWDAKRWEDYIDQLVLSRLNAFYFYIWTDVYSIYPGAKFSQDPITKNIHEGVRHAISYARQRGVRVHFMVTPSYGPRDIWLNHPEAHADIDYVKHGFPAVCLNAPGAWDRMQRIWAHEFEWFKEADVIHIWFYDPGGCFCERHGCRAGQATKLARQVKEFGEQFQALNPSAQIDFNFWPMWIWEERMGPFRSDFLKELQRLFPRGAHRQIGAAGAWGGEASLPTKEREAGMRTSNFIFGSNPESGYIFLMPNLAFHSRVMKDLKASPYRDVFGHRLEVWTKLPATFFMGEFMWNSEAIERDVVRRWAEWQTAGAPQSLDLAESILMLEQFTAEGASLHTAGRARMVGQRAMAGLTPSGNQLLSYYPAMLRAMELLGRGASSQGSDALAAVADLFVQELRAEPLFAPMGDLGRGLFTNYINMTKVGTNQRMF